MTNNDNIIQVENVSKAFRVGEQDVQVLKGITFSVKKGDFVIIFGPSGCGKSTLLHTILGLEPPNSGTISFSGTSIYDLKTEDDRNDFRKKHVGMVYQQANWVKSLSVKENVAFPLFLLGQELESAYQKAVDLLKQVGMGGWCKYVPTELSSGQQQRVALMRAMINNPSVVIADEPTGNLDYESGQMLMQYLYDINKDQGKTIMMVTHDLEYIKYAKTIVQMLDGQIIKIYEGEAKKELMGNLKTKKGVGIVNGKKFVDENIIKKQDDNSFNRLSSASEVSNKINQPKNSPHVLKSIDDKKFKGIKHGVRGLRKVKIKNFIRHAFKGLKKLPFYLKVFFTVWAKDIALFTFLLIFHLISKLFMWITSFRIFPRAIVKALEKVFSPIYNYICNRSHRREDEASPLNLINLALKNMVFKKSRAIITIGGMSLGIGAIVFLVSLGYGVNHLIIKRVAKLGEMQQADVSSQPGSQLKLTDESVADFNDIHDVKHVLPLISIVARVNYNNSVSDMPVYGVTREYLLQSAIKPTEGNIFESNKLAKSFEPKVVGQIAGASIEVKDAKNGDLIREVQVTIDPGQWIRVRRGPGTNNKILGYTKRVEGQVLAEEYWGGNYISDNNVGKEGIDEDGNSLGKWIKTEILLWQKQSCGDSDADCENGEYVVDRDENNTQRQSIGYFAEIGVSIEQEIENGGKVLGDSTALNIIEASSFATAGADLELAAIASAASILETEQTKVVAMADSAQKKAVVNTAMLNVLGISKTDAVGQTFETTFVITGDTADSQEKIESVASSYEIEGVITDDTTPYFYAPFVDLRGLGIKNFSQIKIVANDKNNLSTVRQQIEAMGFLTHSVADTVEQIDSLFATIRAILAALGMVALAVASLGMFNTLTVSLLERTREVGLMKAMGMKSHEVRSLFLTESMIMGFFGGLGGILLGFLAGKFLGLLLSSFAAFKGIGYIDISHIPFIFVAAIFLLSLSVGVITGIYPARRATKISALNALRYE